MANAAQELVGLRDAWLNPPDTAEELLKSRTLTNLYNAQPTWLIDAHRTLDEAVFGAYGWNNLIEDDEIIDRLLHLNHERAACEVRQEPWAEPRNERVFLPGEFVLYSDFYDCNLCRLQPTRSGGVPPGGGIGHPNLRTDRLR